MPDRRADLMNRDASDQERPRSVPSRNRLARGSRLLKQQPSQAALEVAPSRRELVPLDLELVPLDLELAAARFNRGSVDQKSTVFLQ